MMYSQNPKNRFLAMIKKEIISNNNFGITDVLNVDYINTLDFDRVQYSSIVNLLKKGNINAIKEWPENETKQTEFLEILMFENQSGNRFIATVYDSTELWQNPQVIEIFPFSQ